MGHNEYGLAATKGNQQTGRYGGSVLQKMQSAAGNSAAVQLDGAGGMGGDRPLPRKHAQSGLTRHSSVDYRKNVGMERAMARKKSVLDKNTIDYSTYRPAPLLVKDTLVPIAEMSKLNTQRETSMPITPKEHLMAQVMRRYDVTDSTNATTFK